jgi:hypothetical protein
VRVLQRVGDLEGEVGLLREGKQNKKTKQKTKNKY